MTTSGISRRGALRLFGIGALGVAGAGVLGACAPSGAGSPSNGGDPKSKDVVLRSVRPIDEHMLVSLLGLGAGYAS